MSSIQLLQYVASEFARYHAFQDDGPKIGQTASKCLLKWSFEGFVEHLWTFLLISLLLHVEYVSSKL